MVQVLSKLKPVNVACKEYVHPFNDTCTDWVVSSYVYSLWRSFILYCVVQGLTLLMKGKIPTKEDLKRTFYGVLQSTAFLSGTAFGYSLFLCSLRRLLGNFNLLTVSAIPAFLASVFAILIERPSRRILLCLYVSNVATETVWNMLLSRNMVRNVKYGEVALFSASMALLLTYYKGGCHRGNNGKSDSMFGVLRFVVGPYEEKDYCNQASTIYHEEQNIPNDPETRSRRNKKFASKNVVFRCVSQAVKVYKQLIQRIKCCDRHSACPHPFSCLFYALEGTSKMFSVGLGIQLTLKLVLNVRRLFGSSKSFRSILFKKDTLNLAIFLGGFAGLFRAVLCTLRRITGKDNAVHAIPAGIVAGITFRKYPDTTVALYVLWKAAQITYTMGIDKGVLPKVPGFTEFLYCFSTAVLFHAAILEPTNLRPSYWKFLHSLSGGRIACMDRAPLDAWGLETSKSLQKVLEQTKTLPVVQFL